MKNKDSKVKEIPPLELILYYLVEDFFNNDVEKLKDVFNHMYNEYENYDIEKKTLIDVMCNHSKDEVFKILNS